MRKQHINRIAYVALYISDTENGIMAGECCMEGETTWRKEHLIGYSVREWLWDSQRNRKA